MIDIDWFHVTMPPVEHKDPSMPVRSDLLHNPQLNSVADESEGISISNTFGRGKRSILAGEEVSMVRKSGEKQNLIGH